MKTPLNYARRAISDSDWKDINLHVGLPNAARADIDKAITFYRYAALNLRKRPTAKQVRKRLKAVAAASLKLIAAVDHLGDEEHLELVTSNFFWGEFEHASVKELSEHVREVFQKSKDDAKMITELIADTVISSDAYSKKSPQAVNALVASCDEVLKKFGRDPVSRAKPVMKMLVAVFRLADPLVSPSSIEEAVKRVASRGSLRSKKGSNPPQKTRASSERSH